MFSKKKVIEVKLIGGGVLPGKSLENLLELQGELKTLHERDAEKIKQSFLKYGFRFPVYVWEGPEAKYHIIDGHQRIRVLKRMINDEGYELQGGLVPVVEIEADSMQQAKELVLLAASRYAKVNENGLHDFLEQADLDIENLQMTIDLPDVYLGRDGTDISTGDERGGEDFNKLTEEFDVSKTSMKDGNYFYVEYYGNDEAFNELKEFFKDHLKSEHEIDPIYFRDFVMGAKNA
jgi:hypothetical protein